MMRFGAANKEKERMDIRLYSIGNELNTKVEGLDLNTGSITTGETTVGGGQNLTSSDNYIGNLSTPIYLIDFTLEFWAIFTSSGSIGAIINTDGNTSQGIVYNDPYGRGWIGFRLNSNYPSQPFLTPTVDTLYHIAVTRKDGVVTTWVNGKQSTTFNYSNDFKVYYLLYAGIPINYFRLTDRVLYTKEFTPNFGWSQVLYVTTSGEVWGNK